MVQTTSEIVRGDSVVREQRGKALVFAREAAFAAHPQHTDRWTELSTYQDVVGSLVELDFNDWANHTMYFEMVGFTDAGTGYWQLYNTTAAAAVASSEITTTSTTSVRIRSAALAKIVGTKSFKIQHKIVGGAGGDFVNSVMSKIIFRADI